MSSSSCGPGPPTCFRSRDSCPRRRSPSTTSRASCACGQAGSTELLRDEAIRAAEKAHEAGVDVELELWPGAAHVFQIAGFLPEAALALNHIARFVRMRTGWQDIGT